ncbi:serine hydrolase domain-containing protein [Mucilaginibacter hurinus]|nr:serine hydrolase domain-containing protein [Mucilaginibacter hurinus]
MKNLSLILALIFLISSCKKDSTPVKPQPGTKDFTRLDTIMRNNLNLLGNNAGLVLFDKNGNILFKKYYGTWNDNTYIPIASASKWLSSAVIMSLVDEGVLSLNTKAAAYYPVEFAAADRRDMTIRQLFSHTSGFEGSNTNLWVVSKNITLQQAVQGIGHGGKIGAFNIPPAKVLYGNGKAFAYGGISMHVAAGMAEKATGKTWDVLFKERIADKCNMTHTDYAGLGTTTNYMPSGSAGTRLPDYTNFLLMILNNGRFKDVQVLSENAVAEMTKDQTNGVPFVESPTEGDPVRGNARYGLGCWIEKTENGNPVEIGSQGAFGFSPWIDKKHGIGGILFVKTTVSSVSTKPTFETAPYTLIRQEVNRVLEQ